MVVSFLDTWQQMADPNHAALLVIDMQRGSWPPKDNEPESGSEILPRLTPFVEEAHRANVGVIYIRNSFSHWVNLPPWEERFRTGRKYGPDDYMIEETPGVDVMEGLTPRQGDLVLNKHFWNVFAWSPIDIALRSRQIRTVILTGGGVTGAVESAAKDAVVRGYYCLIAKDCVWPENGPAFDVGVGQLHARVGTAVTSQEISDVWRNHAK
jgi:nicotinamidase-related amidase